MKEIAFRRAGEADLPAIVAMLADDPLGQGREQPELPLHDSYKDAFAAIEADPNQLLVVMTEGTRVVGTLQLTFIPGLSHKGAWRGEIEGVRVASDRRGSGFGRRMIEWAIAECRARGCRMVQLTTNKKRVDAHRFYEQLGFMGSHFGYKLAI